MKNREEVIKEVAGLKEVFWINDKKMYWSDFIKESDLKYEDVLDAEKRLHRFAPLILRLFPETENGIIESPMMEISKFKEKLSQLYDVQIQGDVYLKCDSHLKIAGSIKARGGIYEVLRHAENLAIKNGLLSEDDDYSKMADEEFRKFYSSYSIGVGSTGNLGLSIGIISSALGFKVTVHMSRDAKEWKKQLLRNKGAIVIEYDDDYSKAVAEGRKQCQFDDRAYFIDDENSKELFLGYSVAALRLKEQLIKENIEINKENQLFVYLPCGVGGAPAGITFGLKNIFKDDVHCYFVEPTHSPCMLLGLLSGKYNEIHVGEYGIDNVTEADGLAVGSPSRLASIISEKLIDGIYTLKDQELFKMLALLFDSEKVKIEPSAAAALLGPLKVVADQKSVHIAWATGGLFLPENLYEEMYRYGKEMMEK